MQSTQTLIYIGVGLFAVAVVTVPAAAFAGITWAVRAAKGGTTANGTRYCRTCGFADCPGKDTGNCPRWPARDAA